MAQPDTKSWDGLNRGGGSGSTPGVDPKFTPKDYVPNTATPVTRFRFLDVDPPSFLYVRPPDVLFLKANTNNLAGDTVLFTVRVLRADGTITTEKEQLVVVAGWAANNLFIPLPEGYLLSIAAESSVVLQRGVTFAQAYVSRAGSSGNDIPQQLFSDYVTRSVLATWPNGRTLHSLEGPGNIRSITGTVPAAGAEINEVVPVRTQWRLIAFRYTLTTAVAAANRESNLVIDDGVNPYVSDTPSFAQVASLAFIYSWMLGVQKQAATQSNLITLPSPTVTLPPGHRIRTSTTNIQAADQYTAPQYLVEEWANNT